MLQWPKRVDLKQPEVTFCVLENFSSATNTLLEVFLGTVVSHHEQRASRGTAHNIGFSLPPKLTQVGEGGRRLVVDYDLKKRRMIGTTSMDAELALIMANVAQVRRAS